MHRELLEVAGRFYEAVLEEDEEGWWVVEVPELPGCISQGQSYDEAIRNIQEAIQCYLDSLQGES